MTDDSEEWIMKGELLIQLRQGVRRSRQLALELVADPLMGQEAQGLLGRLEAIRHELDRIQATHPVVRRAVNDPFWTSLPANLH